MIDAAREVTRARYGALGVAEDHGGLESFITSGMSQEERACLGDPPLGHGLLGVILRGTQPVRVARIADHPLVAGFPPGHPPMTCFLGTPVMLRGRNVAI